ncbi:hypothetical protein ACTMU2_26805 [Cupriavidus basilensis]
MGVIHAIDRHVALSGSWWATTRCSDPAGLRQIIRPQLRLGDLDFLDDQHPVEFGHLHRSNPRMLAGMIADRMLQRVERICAHPRTVGCLPRQRAGRHRIGALVFDDIVHRYLLVVGVHGYQLSAGSARLQ